MLFEERELVREKGLPFLNRKRWRSRSNFFRDLFPKLSQVMPSSTLYLDVDPAKVERLSNKGKAETFYQKIINSTRKGDRGSIFPWLASTYAPSKKYAWVSSTFFPYRSYRAFAVHRSHCTVETTDALQLISPISLKLMLFVALTELTKRWKLQLLKSYPSGENRALLTPLSTDRDIPRSTWILQCSRRASYVSIGR